MLLGEEECIPGSVMLVYAKLLMTGGTILHRCGHCKRLAPTWGELADFFANDDKVSIDHVDCTKQKSVCSKAKVGICICRSLSHKAPMRS